MNHQERSFQIIGLAPLSAFCTFCRRKFVGQTKPGENSEDVISRVREEFDRHDCSQTAPPTNTQSFP